MTSPWIEDNDYVLGVTENAFSLVRDLTHMCAHTKVIITIIIISTITIITIILSVTRRSSLDLSSLSVRLKVPADWTARDEGQFPSLLSPDQLSPLSLQACLW